MVACEALVRWQHPAKGILSPEAFLPTAEETGMLAPLGWWVLNEACRQMRSWQNKYEAAREMGVSVNIAGVQLINSEALALIEGALKESGLDPAFLRLELTENGIRQFGEAATPILRKLKRTGLQVYLDDFGTGYSSLAYLHRLPIDVAKIDRSFISGRESKNGGHKVVQAMSNLLHELGMKVAVEGVENAAQLNLARSLGCEIIQGFVLAKPMEAGAFGRFLAHQHLRDEIASLVLSSGDQESRSL
ncbi:MAG: EAL domain-containing protein, partial [Acidobacteriota bacterium]